MWSCPTSTRSYTHPYHIVEFNHYWRPRSVVKDETVIRGACWATLQWRDYCHCIVNWWSWHFGDHFILWLFYWGFHILTQNLGFVLFFWQHDLLWLRLYVFFWQHDLLVMAAVREGRSTQCVVSECSCIEFNPLQPLACRHCNQLILWI